MRARVRWFESHRQFTKRLCILEILETKASCIHQLVKRGEVCCDDKILARTVDNGKTDNLKNQFTELLGLMLKSLGKKLRYRRQLAPARPIRRHTASLVDTLE